MSEKQAEPSNGLGSFKDVRAFLLVLVASLYGFGYLTWAIYAVDKSFGHIPLVDGQYILAGILPVLTLALTYGVFRALMWLYGRLPDWVGKSDRLQTVLGVVAVIAIFGVVAGDATWYGNLFGQSGVAQSVFMTVVFAIVMISAASEARKTRLNVLWLKMLTWTVVVLIGLFLYLGFLARVFPNMPAALGGPTPRYAELDLDASSLSAETLTLLAPERSPQNSNNVLHTGVLTVYLSLGDRLILEPAHASEGEGEMVELPRSSINAIYWRKKPPDDDSDDTIADSEDASSTDSPN